MGERCGWCGNDPQYVAYHDTEWGVPEQNGRALFELMVLESFQSGLAWSTILRKRAAFRAAFAGFDPDVIARWGAEDVARLLRDPGIVRHRGKIEGAIASARAWVEMGSERFADTVWHVVDGAPVQNTWRTLEEVPAQTDASRALAKALKQKGVKFLGPTTAYAFMQAAGLVNDHLVTCPRHAAVAAMAART